MTTEDRMRSQLQRQLGYIHRSARLFDLGYLDEAVRIATCLRVLFHDKPRDPPNQGSIHKLLGRPPIALRTTVKPSTLSPSVGMFDGLMHLPGNMRPWNDYLNGDVYLLELDAWWSQVMFVVDGHHVNRRQLVLWAAEKDGGAHSDTQLHSGYEALFRMWTLMSTDSSQSSGTPVPYQHLFALRRFALEVLSSESLLNLAWPDGQRPEMRIIADWPQSWSPVMDRVHDIASTYFDNLQRAASDRDADTVGNALQLVDEIRLPLSEWHADSLTRKSQYEAALNGYAKIQATHPGHQHSLYALGFVSHRLGQPVEAEKYLEVAVANDPNHIPSLIALANIHLSKDSYKKARTLYERVLELDCENIDAKINIQISKLSEKALESGSELSALTELGYFYLSINLEAGARESFQKNSDNRLREPDCEA